jgi:hypothetical protein
VIDPPSELIETARRILDELSAQEAQDGCRNYDNLAPIIARALQKAQTDTAEEVASPQVPATA